MSWKCVEYSSEVVERVLRLYTSGDRFGIIVLFSVICSSR